MNAPVCKQVAASLYRLAVHSKHEWTKYVNEEEVANDWYKATDQANAKVAERDPSWATKASTASAMDDPMRRVMWKVSMGGSLVLTSLAIDAFGDPYGVCRAEITFAWDGSQQTVIRIDCRPEYGCGLHHLMHLHKAITIALEGRVPSDEESEGDAIGRVEMHAKGDWDSDRFEAGVAFVPAGEFLERLLDEKEENDTSEIGFSRWRKAKEEFLAESKRILREFMLARGRAKRMCGQEVNSVSIWGDNEFGLVISANPNGEPYLQARYDGGPQICSRSEICDHWKVTLGPLKEINKILAGIDSVHIGRLVKVNL